MVLAVKIHCFVTKTIVETHQTEAFWTHLYWLTVLADQGSFTKAALRLNVSKATVSLHIAELERATGVSLVQRTTRSVRLTTAGARLVEQLQAPYQVIANSFSALQADSGVVKGLVRVTAPVAFARQHLTPHLAAFLQEHKGVRVQLEVSDRIVSLAAEGFDVAIRHSELVPETHVQIPLCSTATVLVATPAYLARHGVPAIPMDLHHHACLYYPRGIALPRWTLTRVEALADAAPVVVTVNGPFATNNSEALRDAALAGLGIALLPDFSAQAPLQAGALVKVLPAWRCPDAFAPRLHIVRPYAANVAPAVAALIAYFRRAFRDVDFTA